MASPCVFQKLVAADMLMASWHASAPKAASGCGHAAGMQQACSLPRFEPLVMLLVQILLQGLPEGTLVLPATRVCVLLASSEEDLGRAARAAGRPQTEHQDDGSTLCCVQQQGSAGVGMHSETTATAVA